MAADLGWSPTISMDDLAKMSETDKGSIAPTHFYDADGVDRGMVILSDRIAFSRNGATLEPPGSSSGPQLNWMASFGLTELRSLGDTAFSLYSTQQPITAEFISALTESGFADSVVPVFGVLESQTEVVLLNEVIVALPEGVVAQDYFADAKFSGYRPLDGTPDQFVAQLSAGYGEQALEAINHLKEDSQVEWVSPNFYQNWQKFSYIPNDPRFTNQWHMHNTGQGGGLVDTDSNLPEAWEYFQPGGPPANIIIGMVDDGMPTNHPDLNAWVNTAEVGGTPGVDDDGNGWIDDFNGWNFVNNNNVSIPDTSNDMHGTSVSGVAAARGDNGIGVAGASYNSSVISVRMFRGNSVASDANIAAAIYYTSGRTQNGLGTWQAASIVNHSWGGGANSSAINNSLTWATSQGRGGLGVIHVFASGNGFASSVSYPSSLSATNPGLMSIGAVNNKGEKSDYSNYGSALDVVTPSHDTRDGYLAIDTTDRVGSAGYAPGDYTGTGSTGFGGTSSAAPLAVGIGALALARAEHLDVDLTAADVKKLYRNNTKLAGSAAYDIATGRTPLLAYGLLDAESLVKGIGRAQLSVTTDRVVLDDGGEVDFGSAIVGGVQEVTFRVRNQGTETLNLAGLSVSSVDFTISQGFADTQLALGETTTFVVRFAPTSAGTKAGVVSISSNDNLTPSLEFAVVGLANATNISGYAYEDRNANGTFDAGEAPFAGRQVFIDQNSNGVFDPELETASPTNSTPVGIVDNTTITSTINVSGFSGFLTDVNVRVNATHSYLGDINVALVAPDGTRVELFNRRGGSADNLVNTVFDDQAANSISTGSAPFTGSFRPETSLAALNGLFANGAWKLEITDNASSDQGTLNNWTLYLTSGERATTTDQFGFYYFLDVANGSYLVGSNAPSGWTASGTTQYPITISNPNDSLSNRNFGAGKNDRFYAHVFNDVNGNGAVNGGEAGLAGRTLFLDANSNGTFDPPVQVNFTNNSATPINSNATINLPITVSGVGQIADIDVTVNLTHTWTGDLEISLISPTGTQIMLSNRRGSSGDNYTNTRFDDEAATSITSSTPPFTGSFQPEQPLSQLDGLTSDGTWNLRIRDVASGDDGTFLNWTLHLTAASDVELETDAYGWASVDLPSGNSTISLIPVAGWEYTLPSTGSRSPTASGSPFYNQLYGTRQPSEGISDTLVYYPDYTGSGANVDTVKSLAKEGAEPTQLTFDNLTNSAYGLSGIGFEIPSIPGTLTASDFVFQVSPTGAFDQGSNPPASWAPAPAPSSVSVVQGASDLVMIEWPDNAIADRWLRVTVKANANTGLTTPEVYYIGHLLGETTGAESGIFTVSFADISEIRNAVGNGDGGASSIYDIDKSGLVSFADISVMRSGVGSQLSAITIGGSGDAFLTLHNGNDLSGTVLSTNANAWLSGAAILQSVLPNTNSAVNTVTLGSATNITVEPLTTSIAESPTADVRDGIISNLVADTSRIVKTDAFRNIKTHESEVGVSDVDQFFADLALANDVEDLAAI